MAIMYIQMLVYCWLFLINYKWARQQLLWLTIHIVKYLFIIWFTNELDCWV